LAALEELADLADYATAVSNVELVPALVRAGGLRAVSSGVRSSDAECRTAAWGLAAGLCRAGPSAAHALLAHDKAAHPPARDGANVGLFEILAQELAGLVYEGTLPQPPPPPPLPTRGKAGHGGARAAPGASRFDDQASELGSGSGGGPAAVGATALALDVGALLPRLAVLVALTAPPLGRGGYRAAFADGLTKAEAAHYAQSAGVSGRSADAANAEASAAPEGWQSAARPPAAEAGCAIGDPRVVWALVELLAQLNPEFRAGEESYFPLTDRSPAGGRREGGSEGGSEGGDGDSGHGAGPGGGAVRPVMRGGGEGVGGARMLQQLYADGLDAFEVAQLLGELQGVLVEALHHAVVGDPSRATVRLLAARKPLSVLHHLAWAQDDEVFLPATLALHRILDRLGSVAREQQTDHGDHFGETTAEEEEEVAPENHQEAAGEDGDTRVVATVMPTTDAGARQCIADTWAPLFSGVKTATHENGSTEASGKAGAASDVQDGLSWAAELELDAPPLSGE
jgi:hypothetical protein